MVEFNAHVDTLAVSDRWKKLSTEDRKGIVKNTMDGFERLKDFELKLIDVNQIGEVIVEYDKTPPASLRGQYLLALESHLKAQVDPGITIWHVSLGDKNSLRRLRGVTVK
jgi:hypothetical protein